MKNENILLLTDITNFYKIEIYLSTHSELLIEIRMHQEISSGDVTSYYNIQSYNDARMNLPFELEENDTLVGEYINNYFSKKEEEPVQDFLPELPEVESAKNEDIELTN